ncbi:MAG: hypothetical protein U9N49_07205 [Campylobacterota bacterium]|nr:hypothetical protein [Campylobacterota bacterium]
MELVYLWVEEYKNIKEQGFNFSPRFECDYDHTTNNFTICNKEKNECLDDDKKKCKKCEDNNYIENFFGDNINITAIVGENGSGKSQLLKLIWNGNYHKKYFAVILNSDNSLELVRATHQGDYQLPKETNNFNITLEEDSSKYIPNLTNIFYTNETTCLDTESNEQDNTAIVKNFEVISRECMIQNILNKNLEVFKLSEEISHAFDTYKDKVNTLKDDINDHKDCKDIDTDVDDYSLEYEIEKLHTFTSNGLIAYEKMKIILDSEIFEKSLHIIYDNEISWYKDMKKPTSIKLFLDDDKRNNKHQALNLSDKVLLYYTNSYQKNNKNEIQKYEQVIEESGVDINKCIEIQPILLNHPEINLNKCRGVAT